MCKGNNKHNKCKYLSDEYYDKYKKHYKEAYIRFKNNYDWNYNEKYEDLKAHFNDITNYCFICGMNIKPELYKQHKKTKQHKLYKSYLLSKDLYLFCHICNSWDLDVQYSILRPCKHIRHLFNFTGRKQKPLFKLTIY